MKTASLKKVTLLALSLLLLSFSLMAREHKMNPKKYDVFAKEEQLSIRITFSCKEGKIPQEIQVWDANGPFDDTVRLWNMKLINEKELIYKPYANSPEVLVGVLSEPLIQTNEQQEACSTGATIFLNQKKVILDSNFGIYFGVKNVKCFYNTAEDGIPFSGTKNAVSYTLFAVDEANKKVFWKDDYDHYDYKNGRCANAKTILIGTGRVLVTPFLFLGWVIIGMP